MKQKRKVKSLISSNGENKNLLTALLFLVGGVLFCGALALFASIGGVASAENSDVIEYPGIDDKKEVLLRFGLIDEGGTTAVNEMFLTGKAFYVNGNAGLSVDGASDMALGAGKYINFLGGKTDGSNIDSNNVTIIGGNQVKIMENNDNTTFLGGSSNTVNQGYSESVSVSPVMLGGQSNTIGSNQEGSAIIGGRNNEIGGSASYDFVIGGENNNIGSNSKNAIVGGARVTVNGGNSNLFAFSAGSEFNPKGGNAFYLNVQHGLGLNKAASDLSENNLGVDSNGAVSFGPIDITSSARKCTSDDYGVQGSFEGCLVGCTKLGADNGGKWEMVDHGDKCKRLCEDVYSAYCIMSPIEPAKPDPYTSYCTTNGVDTGHSHHCGGEALVLPNYQNVLFETKLIDSDDSCPKPGTANWTENRCVFKCDGEYHLTGDQTGMGGRTKCYKDCKLPWDGTKIKHNETRIAYNTDETYCAFPSGSPASPHTCANHKKTIICQNGTLYLQKSNGQADTAHPAITDGYVYSGCMLNQYRCNTDVYNYSASDITSSSKFNDTVATWNLTDRGTTNGTRGVYRLCIDYNTNPNIVQQLNGEKCDALNLNSSVSPKRYTTHYQWVGCRPNYHTGAGYETVCMKDCTLKKTNNQVQYYRHNTTVVGYKTKQETCTSKCESATLVCNDGKWRLGSLNGTQTTAYVYNDCTLKDYTCPSRYNVTETEKQAHESTSIYGNSCVPYKANNTDKVTCTAQSTKYELTDCKSGYHTVNGKRCVSNNKQVNCNTTNVDRPPNSSFNVVLVWVSWKSSCGWKGSDSTCWNSPVDCNWECNTNYHQEGSFLCCHDGEHSEDGSCTSNTSSAQCIEAGGVPNSHYVVENVSITYNEATGTWSTPRNCNWVCDEGFTQNGNKCDEIPDPVIGDCGSVKYTCDAGTPKDETTTPTEYQWICGGANGGADSELCTAPRSSDGWCKSTHRGCYAGNDTNHNETDDEYTWTCEGINGGDDADCSEPKTVNSVNGLCSILKDECMAGTYEDATDTSTDYKWKCVGSNGGTTDNCSIDKCEAKGCYRSEDECNEAVGHTGPGTACYTDDDMCYCSGGIDGVCGTTVDDCDAGIYQDVTDTNTQYKWNCLGSNLGGDAHCSKDKPVNVKFTIVNNSDGDIVIDSVDVGIRSATDPDIVCEGTPYNCGTDSYPEGVVIFKEASSNSVTCGCPSSFVAGTTYKFELRYHDGPNPAMGSLQVNSQGTITPTAGDNEYIITVESHGPGVIVTNGVCGNGINNCSAGALNDVTDTDLQYKRDCVGSNGGTTDNCSKDKDPECGNVHYNCTVGTSLNNDNSSATMWTWDCSNGGKTISCSQLKSRDASCGAIPHHYECAIGTLDTSSKHEGNTEWTWTCKGENGGDDIECIEACPTGQTIQNGVCKSSPITINICPYVTYDEPQQYGSCYLGNALHNVYYAADRAVPKSISIEATFTYRTLSRNNPSSCSYDSDQKSATYTIEAGNTQSSELQGSSDILHRFATTYSATYGFEKYFDPSFISMSAEVSDTFTYNGQEYIINVKNDACGEPVVNTRVDGKCGTNNTPATRCSAGTVSDYNSSTRSRKCVGENGGDTVSCKYSCTTVGGTCECPDGYEMNSSNNCVFVGYKFCAHQLCKCDNFQIGNNTPCGCIDGTYEGKGSNTCFGDSSQKAKGIVGQWVARIEPYTNSRISADGFDGSNADDEFHLVGFKDESSKCADPYANNLDYLVNNCSSLLRGTNSQLDNGFILTDCSGVPSTAEACCSGGTETCKVMTVGGGSGFEPELLPRD